MVIKFKKLRETAIKPEKATPGSVAYDIRIPEDISLPRGRTIIPLGFAMEIPVGYEAKIEPRSGHSAKGMLGYVRCVTNEGVKETEGRFDADVLIGKIDPDYRGEVGVIINNKDEFRFRLNAGQAVAQMTIYKTEEAEWQECEVLSDTERGEGGFGHSGN